jgi:hypothetical protein
MANKYKPYRADDWKIWKKGWQYDGDINDPVYLKERDAFLYNKEDKRAPYNGWWWFRSVDTRKDNRIKLRKRRVKENVNTNK